MPVRLLQSIIEIEDAGSGDGLPSGLAVLTLMSVQDIKKKPAISNGFCTSLDCLGL